MRAKGSTLLQVTFTTRRKTLFATRLPQRSKHLSSTPWRHINSMQSYESIPIHYLDRITIYSPHLINIAFQAFTGLAIAGPINDHPAHNHRAARRSSMDAIEDRIASFLNWPHGGQLRPIIMARAGFYQNSVETDSVACFTCNVVMEGWNEQCDPIIAHRRASPNCTWKNDTYMTTWDERFHSFHTWPIDIKPLPAAMASAGLYHSNKSTDAVTCFSCEVIINDWKKNDDPIQRHLLQSCIIQPCEWISKVTNQPAQYAPPTPPTTPPPAPAPASIPHKCGACHKTFPSGNSFRKHRRQSHRNVGGRIGVPLKRPRVMFLGRYRVSKATKQRMKQGRRGNTDLFGRD